MNYIFAIDGELYIQKFYIYFLIKYISFYILKFEKKIMGNELMINNIRLKMAIID